MASLLLFVLLLAPDREPAGGPHEPDELEALQAVVQAAVKRIGPSVVTIETVGGVRRIDVPDRLKEKMTPAERPRRDDRNAPEDEREGGDEQPAPEGRTPRFKDEWKKMLAWPGFKKAEGPTTGLVLTEDGHIITSAWNFESKPSVITVTTEDGKTSAARLLGIDRAAGLALLKIDRTGLPVPEFRDPKTVRVGAWTLAVGRSIVRRGVSIRYGIVSAKNRIEGNAIQTDAAASPVNYGGPLVDVHGRVYGVIVPLGSRGEETNPNWYDSGIGFAAPVDPQLVLGRLGEEGVELEAAFLGVASDREHTKSGALVKAVSPGQAAEKAGIEKGDVIVEVDGVPVENGFTLRFAIGRRRAGEKVEIVVQRGDEKKTFEVVLGKRPEQDADKKKLPIPLPGPGGPGGNQPEKNR